MSGFFYLYMTKIGLLSDTHSIVPEQVFKFFETCNEIWHCGDIGYGDTLNALKNFKPFRAVYGNIDGQEARSAYPKYNEFTVEEVPVLMTHIGGYPGKYEKEALAEIVRAKPKLFVCGHSHILKVMYDKKHQLLCINPGAAGKSGFHLVCTAVRFTIDGNKIENLEILEIPKNSK
jgi:uncharacterized protein